MFNFYKGTYVIKTLCKLVQKLTQISLPDADITIASLNSDLNVIWLLSLLFFIIIIISSLQGGKYIKCARGKSIYGNSRWPQHARKCVVGKKITKFARNHRHSIRTGLVFSEDH